MGYKSAIGVSGSLRSETSPRSRRPVGLKGLPRYSTPSAAPQSARSATAAFSRSQVAVRQDLRTTTPSRRSFGSDPGGTGDVREQVEVPTPDVFGLDRLSASAGTCLQASSLSGSRSSVDHQLNRRCAGQHWRSSGPQPLDTTRVSTRRGDVVTSGVSSRDGAELAHMSRGQHTFTGSSSSTARPLARSPSPPTHVPLRAPEGPRVQPAQVAAANDCRGQRALSAQPLAAVGTPEATKAQEMRDLEALTARIHELESKLLHLALAAVAVPEPELPVHSADLAPTAENPQDPVAAGTAWDATSLAEEEVGWQRPEMFTHERSVRVQMEGAPKLQGEPMTSACFPSVEADSFELDSRPVYAERFVQPGDDARDMPVDLDLCDFGTEQGLGQPQAFEDPDWQPSRPQRSSISRLMTVDEVDECDDDLARRTSLPLPSNGDSVDPSPPTAATPATSSEASRYSRMFAEFCLDTREALLPHDWKLTGTMLDAGAELLFEALIRSVPGASGRVSIWFLDPERGSFSVKATKHNEGSGASGPESAPMELAKLGAFWKTLCRCGPVLLPRARDAHYMEVPNSKGYAQLIFAPFFVQAEPVACVCVGGFHGTDFREHDTAFVAQVVNLLSAFLGPEGEQSRRSWSRPCELVLDLDWMATRDDFSFYETSAAILAAGLRALRSASVQFGLFSYEQGVLVPMHLGGAGGSHGSLQLHCEDGRLPSLLARSDVVNICLDEGGFSGSPSRRQARGAETRFKESSYIPASREFAGLLREVGRVLGGTLTWMVPVKADSTVAYVLAVAALTPESQDDRRPLRLDVTMQVKQSLAIAHVYGQLLGAEAAVPDLSSLLEDVLRGEVVAVVGESFTELAGLPGRAEIFGRIADTACADGVVDAASCDAIHARIAGGTDDALDAVAWALEDTLGAEALQHSVSDHLDSAGGYEIFPWRAQQRLRNLLSVPFRAVLTPTCDACLLGCVPGSEEARSVYAQVLRHDTSNPEVWQRLLDVNYQPPVLKTRGCARKRNAVLTSRGCEVFHQDSSFAAFVRSIWVSRSVLFVNGDKHDGGFPFELRTGSRDSPPNETVRKPEDPRQPRAPRSATRLCVDGTANSLGLDRTLAWLRAHSDPRTRFGHLLYGRRLLFVRPEGVFAQSAGGETWDVEELTDLLRHCSPAVVVDSAGDVSEMRMAVRRSARRLAHYDIALLLYDGQQTCELLTENRESEDYLPMAVITSTALGSEATSLPASVGPAALLRTKTDAIKFIFHFFQELRNSVASQLGCAAEPARQILPPL